MENGMNGDEHSRKRSSSPSLHRSNSRGSTKECRSLVQRNQSISAKQIRFYPNGDKFHPGLKLAVSDERYRELDSLLTELSKKLELSTGAVRFIFDAETGKQVYDVCDMEYGTSYVCSSCCSFDRGLQYGQQLNNWSINSKKGDSCSLTKPVVKTHHFLPDSKSRDFIKPKLTTIIKNGKPPQKKVTMLLNSKTAISLEQVLNHLSDKKTLGKVDRLCTLDAKPINKLQDLFHDDKMFIALSSQEKLPEEKLEIDIQSYKIAAYKDLKRPCNLKRSSSLRTPRYRRESDGDLHRPARPVKRSSSVKSAGNARNRSQSPGPRYNGHSPKGHRPKSPASSSGRKTPTGSAGAHDELYPAQVFERDPLDSDLIDQINGFGMDQETY